MRTSSGPATSRRLGAAPRSSSRAEIERTVRRIGPGDGVVTAAARSDGNSTPSCATKALRRGAIAEGMGPSSTFSGAFDNLSV